MSDCADMTTALARELTQGIKNEVEDLSSVFKKMAKLKSGDDSERLNIGEIVELATTSVLYDPPQENIENPEVTVLHSLLQFRVADFPADFDPFAQEAA